MRVTILGAGAMGSALVIPFTDRGHEVRLWSTEYDVQMLKTIEEGKEHPRLGVKLPPVKIYYPEDLPEAIKDADIVVIALLVSA